MAGYVVLGKQFVGGEESGGDPGVFLLCRQLIATMLSWALATIQYGPRMPRPEHRTALHLLGVINYINAMGFVWGFKLTSAFLCAVMQLSIPVLTLSYAAWRGDEAMSSNKAASVLVTVAGCGLVTFGGTAMGAGPGKPPSWKVLVGLLLLLLQCTSFVGLVVVQKPFVAMYPVPWVVAWSYLVCTAWTLFSALIDGSLLRIGTSLSSPSGLAIIVYSATLGCVVYFLLIAYASKHLSATTVSVTVSLEPLAVSAIGILFFEEQMQLLEMIGYVVAAVGSLALTRAMSQPTNNNDTADATAITANAVYKRVDISES